MHYILPHMSYKFNQIFVDDFGRASGVLAINKPVDITSHDVVNRLRRDLKTKQIGHAGALDPFASGVLIMLVGKATKYSDLFLNSDKSYLATVLFGRSTDSADPEGKVLQDIDTSNLNFEQLSKELNSIKPKFVPEYEQYVPVYSSVKVGGEKLRVLARSSDKFEIIEEALGRKVVFTQGEKLVEVVLPKHLCKINRLDFSQPTILSYEGKQYASVVADVDCSKGTYIRTLAEDIGFALPGKLPAMLSALCRTRVADIHLNECLELDQIPALFEQSKA